MGGLLLIANGGRKEVLVYIFLFLVTTEVSHSKCYKSISKSRFGSLTLVPLLSGPSLLVHYYSSMCRSLEHVIRHVIKVKLLPFARGVWEMSSLR
jgi:hypothetical protein